MTYAWSMVIYLLLLTDSGLTDTKANLLFVQVFIPLTLVLKRGQLIKILVFLSKLKRLLRGCQFLGSKQK